MTLPLVVVLAFVIAAATGNTGSSGKPDDPLAAITVAARPLTDAQTAACAQVQAQLPVWLTGLTPRIVHTDFAVAWGDPAIVLQCGVARPKDLTVGSAKQDFIAGPVTGPYYDVTTSGGANVYTTVDRAVYIAITIPGKYQAADELPTLSTAIAKALPAVCTVNDAATSAAEIAQLCTRRK